MSGHSHAKTVKRTKETNAEKRGKIFSKLAKIISIAAKDGGNPAGNSILRQAIETSKKFNMPKENIERAIKRGTGELAGEQLEEIMYEAVGTNGVSIIIEGITDNKNRSLSDIRQILQKHNAKLANEGSLKWQFDRRGVILVNLKSKIENRKSERDEIELKAIEAGAEDTQWQKEDEEEYLEIRTQPTELDKVKKGLEDRGLTIESADLSWIAKEEIVLPEKDKESCQKLFDDLDENDAVQNIFSNLAS